MRKLKQVKISFTLVELLVVISIIGTLVAILLPNFMGARERARDAQKIQDAYAIKNALRMYYNDNQAYPAPVGTGNTIAIPTSYMAPSGLGYTYSQTTTDDFIIRVPLENGQGDDDLESQRKCGVGATDKIYAVCAN